MRPPKSPKRERTESQSSEATVSESSFDSEATNDIAFQANDFAATRTSYDKSVKWLDRKGGTGKITIKDFKDWSGVEAMALATGPVKLGKGH